MTDCETCLRAELPHWRWLAYRALQPRPNSALTMIAAAAQTYSVMLGGRPASWYDKHRDEWVRTGDRAELTRMLRHVQP